MLRVREPPVPRALRPRVDLDMLQHAGGAGYIGSHTCCELLKEGRKIVVVDNLCNSGRESLERVMEITNCKADDLVFK